MISPEEKRWMDHLCSLIQAEQDPDQFAVLTSALNDYLEKREFLLKKQSPNKSSGIAGKQAA